MIKKQTILTILTVLNISIFTFFSFQLSVHCELETENRELSDMQFSIFIAVWRGITQAERGFMDYFSQRNINASFIIRDCEKDRAKIPGIFKEMRDTNPDLIYTFGTTLTTNIAGTILDNDPDKFITDIPIIFNIVSDPIGAKLVPNMVTSDRNLTGASHMVPMSAQIKAMKSVIQFDRLGVIFNPQEKNSVLAVEELENIANSNDFVLLKSPIPVDENQKPIEDIPPSTVRCFVENEADLIYLPSDSFIISHSKSLVGLINECDIPTFSATEGPIHDGDALMGLVSRYYNVGQFAGYKAEQILVQKKHPKDIPIETLKRFSFIINMKTAKKLEFYPPITILKFAEVITE
jgi:putative ABC transport system substrate-binding protein